MPFCCLLWSCLSGGYGSWLRNEVWTLGSRISWRLLYGNEGIILYCVNVPCWISSIFTIFAVKKHSIGGKVCSLLSWESDYLLQWSEAIFILSFGWWRDDQLWSVSRQRRPLVSCLWSSTSFSFSWHLWSDWSCYQVQHRSSSFLHTPQQVTRWIHWKMQLSIGNPYNNSYQKVT